MVCLVDVAWVVVVGMGDVVVVVTWLDEVVAGVDVGELDSVVDVLDVNVGVFGGGVVVVIVVLGVVDDGEV